MTFAPCLTPRNLQERIRVDLFTGLRAHSHYQANAPSSRSCVTEAEIPVADLNVPAVVLKSIPERPLCSFGGQHSQYGLARSRVGGREAQQFAAGIEIRANASLV